MQNEITLNTDQELYVIPCGKGFTCHGFDVVEEKIAKLSAELGPIESPAERGTIERYAQYRELIDKAYQLNKSSGWRSSAELTPELIGLEGRRVEVVDKWGKRRRFQVGKSSGWIPCHLEIGRRDSSGGPSVAGAPFQSLRVIR